MVQVLKKHCSREVIDPVRVSVEQMSTESAVAAGWIRNAIVSRMVMHVVNDKHMDVRCDENPVIISPGFGQPKL